MSTSEGVVQVDPGEQPARRPRINKLVPVVGIGMGLVMFGAAAWGGQVVGGLIMLGIMLLVAAGLWFGSRRSESVALLGDDVHEERNVHIHQRAALLTLNIVGCVVIGGFVLELARGGDGDPYAFIACVAGVSYIVTLLILSRRS